MSREFLQVDDVRAALAGRGESRDAKRMDADVRIKFKLVDLAINQLLHGPSRHGPPCKTVVTAAAGSVRRPE
jgi:hypothetical protein